MLIHANTCFVHDADGRIVTANDWLHSPAPRLWIGRTTSGTIWRVRADVPATVAGEVGRLCRHESVRTDLQSQPDYCRHYEALFADTEPQVQTNAGPTYSFSEASEVSGSALRIDSRDADLLQDELAAWVPDIPYQQPFVVSVVGGRAVSVCASVRISPQADEAGVETLPDWRRKGYAAGAVATWAGLVMASGKLALYSTSWNNTASRSLAGRLGLTQFGAEYCIA